MLRIKALVLLLQKNAENQLFHPIYYASWKTSGPRAKYRSYELKVLAIIKLLNEYKVYLIRIHFNHLRHWNVNPVEHLLGNKRCIAPIIYL